jgi:hypothetical protein
MNKKKINVNIFLRKSYVFENHSIEKLFHSLKKEAPKDINIKILTCPFYSSGIIRRLLSCFWALFNQGDINHISGDINFISLFLKKRKTINTFHDCFNIKQYKYFKKIVYKLFWFKMPIVKSNYITCVSNFTLKEINKNFKIDKNKSLVIENFFSLNIKKIKFTNKKNLIKKILIIGTTANKNIERMLQALNNIKCKLFIVGRLSDEQRKYLMDNNFIFDNFVNASEKKVLEIYKNSDLLLFATLYEGFGLPIIESQTLGIPVITSNLEPMKSIAKNSAILVNPYNILDINKKIKLLFRSRKLRLKLIRKGIRNSKKFSITIAKNKYFNLYRKINHENIKINYENV